MTVRRRRRAGPALVELEGPGIPLRRYVVAAGLDDAQQKVLAELDGLNARAAALLDRLERLYRRAWAPVPRKGRR
jgi:hypothetical protein